MAFMRPEITSEPFLVGDNEYCERSACPLSVWMPRSTIKRNDNDALAKAAMAVYAEQCGLVLDTVEIVHDRYWCRLSAPGYMDCTEWDGPYATLAQAKAALMDAYDVDPDTGVEESEAV